MLKKEREKITAKEGRQFLFIFTVILIIQVLEVVIFGKILIRALMMLMQVF